jgi:flagellar biosynthesis chaperone FliJ
LEDLQKSDSLSENNIRDAQQEQRKVMRELQILKKNIHKIIQYTGDIQSTLVEKKII